MNRTHDLVLPFYEGLTVLESVIKINETVSSSATVEKVSDEDFPQDIIKRGLGVKVEDIDWFLEAVQRMLDCLG